jgi:outer membrane protein assembly factor BamE (lipoprotein component of BamABCDE complex)
VLLRNGWWVTQETLTHPTYIRLSSTTAATTGTNLFSAKQTGVRAMPRRNLVALVSCVIPLLLLSACHTTADSSGDDAKRISYATLLSENQINILKISPGQTKQQVMDIMGSSQARVKSTFITNPFKQEFFSVDKVDYEILYYLTRRYPAYTAIKVSQATAIVLKNGKVVGLGDEAVQKAKRGGL